MHAHESGAAHHHGRVSADADRRWLGAALALILALMIGEAIVGVLANSLALLSDAAHLLTDAAALLLALIALRLAKRPAVGGYTYGLKRAEILSAQANGITLLLLSAWLGYEAVRRLVSPPQVSGAAMLITALVGVAVNLAATWCVRRADRRSLNVRGAYLHLLTDLAAFIATAAAGLVVVLSGYTRADAVASLVVVALMIYAGFGLVRDSGRILLEAAPAGLDPARIGTDMAGYPGVAEVHDLHVWEITSDSPALSAHVLVEPTLDCHDVRGALENLLRERYELNHTTLQVDHAQPSVLRIGRGDGQGRPGRH
jgi:cobalt-zinc-cadmium efflux system protein